MLFPGGSKGRGAWGSPAREAARQAEGRAGRAGLSSHARDSIYLSVQPLASGPAAPAMSAASQRRMQGHLTYAGAGGLGHAPSGVP